MEYRAEDFLNDRPKQDLTIDYGENAFRNKQKIIRLQGLDISDVASIKVMAENTVTFHFFNSLGKEIASHVMAKGEKFITKKGLLGIPEYIFSF